MYLFNPYIKANTPDDVGRKALELLRLDSNCNVPKWFAVPVPVLHEFLKSTGLDAKISNALRNLTLENFKSVSAEVKDLINAADFPEDLMSEIDLMLREVPGADEYVSVRSSSGDEDGLNYSFAGLHESHLFVKGLDSVCKHILKVWASAYDSGVLLYRSKNNLPLHPVSMAVIVQRMVNAKISGVVSSADPVTKNYSRVVANAVYGLGCGIGKSGIEADHYIYDKISKQLTTVAGSKNRRVGMNNATGYGVYEFPVEAGLQVLPALSSVQIKKVVDAALEIECFFGRPQDIEFCFDDNGVLYILQSRDITNLVEYGPAAGNYQLWDNSGIVESYSGVTSPMTFSFLRGVYAAGVRSFCDVAGISRRRLEENEELCRSIPGLFQGRIYCSMSSIQRLIEQIPGYKCCRGVVQAITGLKEVPGGSGDRLDEMPALFARLLEYPRVLLMALVSVGRFMTLRLRVSLFVKRVDQFVDKWSDSGIKRMQPHELMLVYNMLEKELLRNWKTPIINDLYEKISGSMLAACCRKWCGDEDGLLHARLLCGETGIITGPAGMLMQLALKIKRIDSVKYIFQTCNPYELVNLVPVHPECKDIAADIERYLKVHGLRCANELKLEEPSMREAPEFLYQMLKNYIDMSDSRLDINAIAVREKLIRGEAEQHAFKSLNAVRSFLFRRVLTNARRGVVNGEKLRLAQVRICDLVRRLLNAAGERLAAEKILDSDQDIYYLTIDEVRSYISGTAITTNLRALVELRQEEYDRYFNTPVEISDCFSTYGMVYNHNTFLNTDVPSAMATGNGSISGVSCSPGRVKGKARVVHSPRDDMKWNKEILVASRADPGWLLLFPAVSAILIENGGVLSNTAVVAREMGIPAIVGIPGLLAAVTDGAQLIVDATAGTVNFV